jgi:hypothetical protein
MEYATIEVVKVTRYRCPHCGRTRSKPGAAAAHVARCFKNPAARSCKTCGAYQPPEPGDDTGYPGCPEGCDAGEDISQGIKTACPSWEARR